MPAVQKAVGTNVAGAVHITYPNLVNISAQAVTSAE